MKKVIYLLTFVLLFSLLMCLPSCQKKPDDIKKIIQIENNVSLDNAKFIAENMSFNKTRQKDLLTNGKLMQKSPVKMKKNISSVTSVPDENGVAVFYIVNYENGGFLILAADKRSEPILAFSENSVFPIGDNPYPSGLVEWLFTSKEGIKDLRQTMSPINKDFELEWENLLNGNGNIGTYGLDPIDDGCTVQTIQKGPYLETGWGQGCGDNSSLPQLSCSIPCNRAWAGCVATAMAQIMKYHEFPSNYSWNTMPNSYGAQSTSDLIYDIGLAVNMSYTCDGSSADTKNKVVPAFKNTFGYSTATYADYNYQIVKSNLDSQRPVILKGGRQSGWWIFSQYLDGHAWVCDGYLSYTFPCSGTGASYLKFNMNWGWDGNFDGWYAFDNFNPSTHTFNYKRGMVYNIKP